MNEHRGSKPWFTEATKITMRWYPSRGAVLDAEERTIKRKRPVCNVQHNLAIDTVRLSPEDIQRIMAMKIAIVCAGILAARYAADAGSVWWLRGRTAAEGIELPPPRNPFKEDPPSAALKLLNTSFELAARPRPEDGADNSTTSSIIRQLPAFGPPIPRSPQKASASPP